MQVFISHASEDRDSANELANRLEETGLRVWRQESVLPGANWANELGQALAESELLIVLFTRGAHHSATLKEEVQFALTEGKYQGRVIPVFVNVPQVEASTDIPWVLLRFQSVYVEGDPPDFTPVVDQVARIVGPERHAAG